MGSYVKYVRLPAYMEGMRVFISFQGAESGLPVWCNLLLALMDEMDAALVREQKASNPRLKKYLDKYQRRGGK